MTFEKPSIKTEDNQQPAMPANVQPRFNQQQAAPQPAAQQAPAPQPVKIPTDTPAPQPGQLPNIQTQKPPQTSAGPAPADFNAGQLKMPDTGTATPNVPPTTTQPPFQQPQIPAGVGVGGYGTQPTQQQPTQQPAAAGTSGWDPSMNPTNIPAPQPVKITGDPGQPPTQISGDKFPEDLNVKKPLPAIDVTGQSKPLEPGQLDEVKTQIDPHFWDKFGGVNWAANNGDFFQNVREAGVPLGQAVRYYNEWAKANDKPELDSYSLYALGKYDPTKSVKEQDEEDEKQKRQQKWERIGNTLIHMANLYGTVNGAPSQQIESAADLQQRHNQQTDRVAALRQAASKPYLDALKARDEAAAAAAAAAKKYNLDYGNLKLKQAQEARKAETDRIKLDLQQQAIEVRQKAAEARAKGDEQKAKYYEAQCKTLESRARYIDLQSDYYPQHMANETLRSKASMVAARSGATRAAQGDEDETRTTTSNILGTEKTETIHHGPTKTEKTTSHKFRWSKNSKTGKGGKK